MVINSTNMNKRIELLFIFRVTYAWKDIVDIYLFSSQTENVVFNLKKPRVTWYVFVLKLHPYSTPH